MSYLAGDKFIIEPEREATCELCGKIAELRPYGPNDENICFGCMKKDEATAKRKFRERMGHVSAVVVDKRHLR